MKKCLNKWNRHKEDLKQKRENIKQYLNSLVNDTIGACAISHSHSAVASSSGGPWMKKPGRVGMVSSFGCGSYTKRYCIQAKISSINEENQNNICLCFTVASTISGDGDMLLPKLPAFRICQEFKTLFEKSVQVQTFDINVLSNIKSIHNCSLVSLNNFITKEFSDLSFGCLLLSSLSLCNSCNQSLIIKDIQQENIYSNRLDVFHSGLSPNFSYCYQFNKDLKPKVVFSYSNKSTKMKHSTYW